MKALLIIIASLGLFLVNCSDNSPTSTKPTSPTSPDEHFLGEVLDDFTVLEPPDTSGIVNVWIHIWFPEGESLQTPTVILTTHYGAGGVYTMTDPNPTLINTERPDNNSMRYCFQSHQLWDEGDLGQSTIQLTIDVTTETDHAILQESWMPQ